MRVYYFPNAQYQSHKCKFSGRDSKPFFPCFKTELSEYIDTIKYSKSSKAMKTVLS